MEVSKKVQNKIKKRAERCFELAKKDYNMEISYSKVGLSMVKS